MTNEELRDKLMDIALSCEKMDRDSKSDTKYYYWAQTIREAVEKIQTIRLIDDTLPLAEKSELVATFVREVMYDTETHADDEHWSWSDNTKAYWQELEDRLKEPTCMEFNYKECTDALYSMASEQNALARRCDYTTSYHKGIESGIRSSIREIDKHMKKGHKE